MPKTRHKTDGVQKLIIAGVIALAVIVVLMIVLSFVHTGILTVGDLEGYESWWWVGTLIQSLKFILYAILALLVVLTAAILNANRKAVAHTAAQLDRIRAILENQGKEIRSLAGLARLSDQAKSLIYRERELEAVREGVHAMLSKQDYASAKALIARMELRPDLAEAAARLRREVESGLTATADEKVVAAAQKVHKFLERREWAQAKREAERLQSLFPNKPRIAALPDDIRNAWSAYKHKLLKEYGEACRVNDVERSIELLKELDKYLTPQEGAALAESARDVFKKKLHNLGVQFAIAVTDQQWSSAVSTGEEIIREYPNSRMAREVREKLDLLRDYASGAIQPSASIIDQPDSPFGLEGGGAQSPSSPDGAP